MTDIPYANNQAARKYLQELRTGLLRGFEIPDPDYAHVKDRKAWDKVRRDGIVHTCMQRRRHGASGPDWAFIGADDEKQNVLVASWMGRIFELVPRFNASLYHASEFIFRGSSYLFHGEGSRQGVKLDEAGNWPLWIPDELKHIDRWRFVQAPIYDNRNRFVSGHWHLYSIADQEYKPLAESELELFTQFFYDTTEETLGYGKGVLTPLYYTWWAKSIVLEHVLRGVGRWSEGMVVAEIDGLREGATDATNTDIQDAYKTELKKQRTENFFTHDTRDKITVHDGPGVGMNHAVSVLGILDNTIRSIILSAQLPSGGGDGVGSLARAEEEARQQEVIIALDRKLMADAINAGVVRFVWERNRRIFEAALESMGLPMAEKPAFVIQQSVNEDPKLVAETIQMLVNAGLKLKVNEAYERTGWSQPDANDEILEAPEPSGGGLFNGLFSNSAPTVTRNGVNGKRI
jgi:hypothetical protein